MVDGKRVAVVVPAHDEERLIETTLAGIPEFVDRILVVDDASTDGGIDGILQRLKLRPGWRVIRRGRNIGATLNIRESIRTVQTSADMPDDDVILLVDGDTVTSDAAALANVTVTGEIIEHGKGPKIKIHKFKNKTGYHKRQGHRQPLTDVVVRDISKG